MPSPRRSARVFSTPRSEPACARSGSWVPIHSPETIFGRKVAFRASVPCFSSASMAPMVSVGARRRPSSRCSTFPWRRRATCAAGSARRKLPERQAFQPPANPVAVELPPTLRRLDGAIDEPRSLPVARLASGAPLPRRSARPRRGSIHKSSPSSPNVPGVENLGQAGDVFQGECDLVDRCLVHGAPPLRPRPIPAALFRCAAD